MPIYEYRCNDCGAEFEDFTLSANGGTTRCRACSSRRVTKLMSAFAVHGSAEAAAVEPGPCGSCGAARRGMCGED